jgi:hypothetical protein
MINGLLFALFALLQCVDFYTTYTIIKTGKGHEANPILAWIFGKIGYLAGLTIVKGLAIAIGFILLQYWYALAIIDILYVWVIFNNIKVMKGN